MQLNSRFAPLLLTAVSLAFFCGAASAAADSYDPDLLVAQVAKTRFTLDSLHSIVMEREIYQSNAAEDAKRRRELLDGLIDAELVKYEARDVSLKNRNGALARIRRDQTMVAGNLYLADIASTYLKLDSATIDTFYNNHITRYSSPSDQRRPRVITVWKTGRAPKGVKSHDQDSVYNGWYAEDKIDSIYVRLAVGEDFASLAWKYSEDGNTRGTFGDVGWVNWQSLGPGAFGDRVKSQPLYQISKPFETDIAWHILQVIAERPAGPVPLDDEIRADIHTHLVQQQQAIFMKKIGDSVLAMTPIEWNTKTFDLPQNQLRKEMVLAVVNNRDTLFAEEYLLESERWLVNSEPPDPAQRMTILNDTYVRYLAWLGFLRDLGYTERQEALAERERSRQAEREAIVHQRIGAMPISEPDSAAIRKYYQDSIHTYGTAKNALPLAWSSIKLILVNQEREKVMSRWRREASARHGVTRHDDRLARLPLLQQLPSSR